METPSDEPDYTHLLRPPDWLGAGEYEGVRTVKPGAAVEALRSAGRTMPVILKHAYCKEVSMQPRAIGGIHPDPERTRTLMDNNVIAFGKDGYSSTIHHQQQMTQRLKSGNFQEDRLILPTARVGASVMCRMIDVPEAPISENGEPEIRRVGTVFSILRVVAAGIDLVGGDLYSLHAENLCADNLSKVKVDVVAVTDKTPDEIRGDGYMLAFQGHQMDEADNSYYLSLQDPDPNGSQGRPASISPDERLTVHYSLLPRS